MKPLLAFASIVHAGEVMRDMTPINEGYPTVAQKHMRAQQQADRPTSKAGVDPLPESFDGRDEWPGCIHPVLDQGQCGSCWAFAASETLSDRFCIESGGAVNVTLSPGDLLACEKLNLGCTCGSLPEWAWHYLQETGIPTNDCVPYTSGGGDTQKCPNKDHQCASGEGNMTLYVGVVESPFVEMVRAFAAFMVVADCWWVVVGIVVFLQLLRCELHAVRINDRGCQARGRNSALPARGSGGRDVQCLCRLR